MIDVEPFTVIDGVGIELTVTVTLLLDAVHPLALEAIALYDPAPFTVILFPDCPFDHW
jgi:hypothetical protein